MDYCNALRSAVYGTSTAVTRRLQMVIVLNAADRLVVGIGKYEHITPVLRDTPLAASGRENTVQDCCSDI